MKSTTIPPRDMVKLIELAKHSSEWNDFWVGALKKEYQTLFNKGYLDMLEETTTTLVKINGKKSSESKDTEYKYRIKTKYQKEVFKALEKIKNQEELKKKTEWEQLTKGVPKRIVNKGEIAVKHWKVYGEELSKREIESIARDLGGGHS